MKPASLICAGILQTHMDPRLICSSIRHKPGLESVGATGIDQVAFRMTGPWRCSYGICIVMSTPASRKRMTGTQHCMPSPVETALPGSHEQGKLLPPSRILPPSHIRLIFLSPADHCLNDLLFVVVEMLANGPVAKMQQQPFVGIRACCMAQAGRACSRRAGSRHTMKADCGRSAM